MKNYARILLLAVVALLASGCHPKESHTVFGARYQPSADVITTSNQGTLSGLAQTIDSVALNAPGMRVWLTGQATVTQDGCYLTASTAWPRCDDVPVGTDVAGDRFNVKSGGNAGPWSITNPPGSGLVGVNDITASAGGGGGGGAVSSVFGRTGAVVPAAGDYTADLVGALGGVDASAVTTKSLSAYTYANGTAGVGATITGNANQACDTIDGLTPSLTPATGSYTHVLVQHGASFADDGLYDVTQVGDGTHPCILTRDPRVDTAAEIRSTQIHITQGISRRGAVYEYINDPNITIGTTMLAWGRVDQGRGPNEYAEWSTDFDQQVAAVTNNVTLAGNNLFVTLSASYSITFGASTTTEQSFINFLSATTTSGSASVSYGLTNPPVKLDPSHWWELSVRPSGPDTLSDGTNTYRLIYGLASTTASSATDGVWVEYTQATDTHWLCTLRASSSSATASGNTVIAGTSPITWDHMVMRHYAGESVVHCYDNGVEMTGSPVTGIPTAAIGPEMGMFRSAGTTSRNANLDWFKFRRFFVTGRQQ